MFAYIEILKDKNNNNTILNEINIERIKKISQTLLTNS